MVYSRLSIWKYPFSPEATAMPRIAALLAALVMSLAAACFISANTVCMPLLAPTNPAKEYVVSNSVRRR